MSNDIHVLYTRAIPNHNAQQAKVAWESVAQVCSCHMPRDAAAALEYPCTRDATPGKLISRMCTTFLNISGILCWTELTDRRECRAIDVLKRDAKGNNVRKSLLPLTSFGRESCLKVMLSFGITQALWDTTISGVYHSFARNSSNTFRKLRKAGKRLF